MQPRHRSDHRSSLRRLGYRVAWRPHPLLSRLETAGLRPVALNRREPIRGSHYTACPLHPDAWAGVWVDRDGSWTSHCGAGGNELDLALFLAAAA